MIEVEVTFTCDSCQKGFYPIGEYDTPSNCGDCYEELRQDFLKMEAEVERLQGELGKFKECGGWETFRASDGELALPKKDCGSLDHYHKEES